MTMMRENSVGHPGTTNRSPDIVNSPPRTAWEIIEDVCNAHVTGELTLTTASPTKTKVYMTHGLVYFAERETDDTLATRLVLAGAINLDQLQRGAIRLNCVEHLGRMFERDSTIERDAVELAIELITEMTLTEIADQPVLSHRLAMYRHHPSGIARWFSSHQSIDEELTPYHDPNEPAAHHSVEEPPVAQLVEEQELEQILEDVVVDEVEATGPDAAAPPADDDAAAARALAEFTDVPFLDEPEESDETATWIVVEPEPAPATLPAPSPWDAPAVPAMAPGPLTPPPPALPTLPMSVSLPPVRIPQQQPPERTLPTVLAPVALSFALAEDGPRLPSLTPSTDLATDHPVTEPVVAPIVEAGDLSNLAPLYAARKPLNGLTSLTPTAPNPSTTSPSAAIETAASDPVLAALASMKPMEPLRPLLPSSPSLPSLTSPAERATMTPITTMTPMTPITSVAPATPIQLAPRAVHTLESIPVPEDVAAAVRRAITAIEAATFAPTGAAPVSFGPIHVTAAGLNLASTDFGAPIHDASTNPHGIPALHTLPPDPMIVLNGDDAMSTLAALSPAPVLASNPVAAPITTERRGALRRLIDGIRRR